MSDLMFEILESEADDQYFFWRRQENKWANLPGVTIGSGPFASLEKVSYKVYFGRGIATWTFKTHKQAVSKALEIASKHPGGKVRHVTRKGKETILTFEAKK